MKKFALLGIVVLASFGVPVAASASVSVPPAAGVPASAPRVEWEHRNFWNRIGKVVVDDVTSPIYRTVPPAPILKDKREYRIVRWEETFETKIVPRYETRTERYVASYTEVSVMETRTERYVDYYNETPLFDTRTESYVAYYNETPVFDWRTETYVSHYHHERVVIDYEPVFSTRQVCTFRWRGSCVEWSTERYQSGSRPVYGTRSTPVYATRSYQVRVGTRYEPVYATRTYQVRVGTRYEPNWDTRTVRVEVGSTTLRISAGMSPVYDWVKVCSLCEIEGYTPEVKVFVGYAKKTVEQVVERNVSLADLNCGGTNDCGDKGREFRNGAWYEFSYHVNVCFLNGREMADPNACRQITPYGGGGSSTTVAPTTTVRVSCEEQGLITALDGTCAPEEEKRLVCRAGVLRNLYVSQILASDQAPVGGACSRTPDTTTTTMPPSTTTTVPPSTTTTVPPSTTTTVPPSTTTVPPSTTTVPPSTTTTVQPPAVSPSTTTPRVPIRPS